MTFTDTITVMLLFIFLGPPEIVCVVLSVCFSSFCKLNCLDFIQSFNSNKKANTLLDFHFFQSSIFDPLFDRASVQNESPLFFPIKKKMAEPIECRVTRFLFVHRQKSFSFS